MKTDELIALLARGDTAVATGAALRRYSLALGGGIAVCVALLVFVLGLHPNLAEVARLPVFWLKLAVSCGIALGALGIVTRAATPGARLGLMPLAAAVPAAAIWALAVVSFVASEAPRSVLVFGTSWDACPLFIALLSVPLFAALIWALRGLAPTSLRLAGAAAGLLAGAAGAAVYTLHCSEFSAPFVAIWYLLGIAIPSAVGAVLGPTLLKW